MGANFADRYGPYAIVTGASAGIGEEFARQLAGRGLNLVLVARRADRLAALADELAASHGIEARVVSVDLLTEAAVDDVLKATEAVDVGLVVLNAGLHDAGLFLDSPVAAHTDLVVLNALRPMQLAHGFGRRLAARGRGGVLLVSSLSAKTPWPYQANYAASKAYLSSLGQALQAEWGANGVDVTVVEPGVVNTDMARGVFVDLTKTPFPVTEPGQVVRTALNALGKKAVVVIGAANVVTGVAMRRLLPQRATVQALLAVGGRLPAKTHTR